MYKLIDRYIEWVVALTIVFITTLSMLKALAVTLDISIIKRLLNYSSLILMGALFLYQQKNYGIKVYDKFFWWFYLFYCLYIFLDITIFCRYPLEKMLGAPGSIFIYFYELVMSLGFLLCVPTIYSKFSSKKYIFLSLLVCTIPSVLFVQYVGVDLIQSGIRKGEEEFIPTLTITYANVPLLVLAVINFKTLLKKRWTSVIVSTIIIVSVVYVLFAYGKRGPILWAIVNILAYFFITSLSIKKYIFVISMIGLTFLAFLDPILEGITDVLPTTGKRMEESIKEGNTDGRFDLEDSKHSTYLIGLENFSRSPIWGYYFRLVTNTPRFKGAYSHNIFIEVLMTMGLIGFIPFMILLLKAYNKSRKIFTRPHTNNQMAFYVLFLCSFLQLQTTGTIVFKYDFWLFLYMLCCIDVLTRTKISMKEVKEINDSTFYRPSNNRNEY